MSRELRHISPKSIDRDDVILVAPNDDLGFGADPEDDGRGRERVFARLRLLWSRRQFLGKVLAYGLAVSLLIAFLIPSRYESTARLMPPDQSSGSGIASLLSSFAGRSGGDGAAGAGGSAMGGLAQDALGIKTSGDLFIGVLGSRTVQDNLITKFDLRKVYRDREWQSAREDLSNRTSVTSDKKSGIIIIKVSDHNALRAAAMGREYIDQLNWVVTQLNTSTAHRERVFLDGRLKEVKKDLEQSEAAFSQFASKSAALDIPAQGKAMVQATAELEGQLIAAQTEMQGLKQVYTENNVRVRSTQARIDELQRQIQKMGGSYAAGEGDSDSIYPSIRQLPLLGVPYADLLRRTKIQEAIFETLTQQDEIAKVDEAKSTPSVKVLDAPDVPENKSFPPRPLIAILGGIIALLGGVGWILSSRGWEQVDSRDPGKALALEVVNDFRSHFMSLSSRVSRAPDEGPRRLRSQKDKEPSLEGEPAKGPEQKS